MSTPNQESLPNMAKRMEPIRYTTGELVEVGDEVEVRRRFRTVRGIVSGVYDPGMPIVPNGDNEYGINIRISEGRYLWGLPNKNTRLIAKRTKPTDA